MAINLTKGQKINLLKDNGEKLEKFCVEVSWGAIETVSKGLERSSLFSSLQ
jgi:tellurium resistance protein TerZ